MEKPKIILEPLLEAQAHDLNAWQCRELARVYERWAHQLRVKAKVLLKARLPGPPKKLKPLRLSQLRSN